MAMRAIIADFIALSSIALAACSSSGGNSAGAGGTATGGAATAMGGSSSGGAATGGAATGGTVAGGAATGGAGGVGTGGAGVAGATAGGTCTPLAPTGAAHKVILSQIVPGMGIEVFNPGTTAVNISDIWFCSDFDYQQVTAPSGKTAVAPGAFVVLSWPATYTVASATGGELLMNLDTFGPAPDNVQSYVCWGNHSGGREPSTQDGITAGVDQLYSGACAPAMTAGALSRKPGTNGMDASSYDSAAAPSLADCPP